MGGLLHLKMCIDKENKELDLQVQSHMDWRKPATRSMLRWTRLRRGTTKASLWDLSSIALQNMHARLLRNQRLPVLSVKKLTRGEHARHKCACALIIYMFLKISVQSTQTFLANCAGQKRLLTTERKLRRLS